MSSSKKLTWPSIKFRVGAQRSSRRLTNNSVKTFQLTSIQSHLLSCLRELLLLFASSSSRFWQKRTKMRRDSSLQRTSWMTLLLNSSSTRTLEWDQCRAFQEEETMDALTIITRVFKTHMPQTVTRMKSSTRWRSSRCWTKDLRSRRSRKSTTARRRPRRTSSSKREDDSGNEYCKLL